MTGEPPIDEKEAPCVAVKPSEAEKTKKILKKLNLLDRSLKAARHNNEVLFPVTDADDAIRILAAHSIKARPCKWRFKISRKTGRLPTLVKSFKQIGEIVVFSQTHGIPLSEYKNAAIRLLQANPRIRSVWLKLQTSGEERIADLVHLAGEKTTKTIVKEYGIRLLVDISKAYYNPRLSTEHYRVAQLAKDSEYILDMFTGVGGFTLHIATLRRAMIIGVDINIEALKLAAQSLRLNKRVLKGGVVFLNSNAENLDRQLQPIFDRIIMNLPKYSLQFVKNACNLLKENGTLHIYTIARSQEEARTRLATILMEHDCKPVKINSRILLDYSPGLSIIAIDASVRRLRP